MVGAYLHVFINLHPRDRVEAVLGARVLPSGRGSSQGGHSCSSRGSPDQEAAR